jgi:hypothetical protein
LAAEIDRIAQGKPMPPLDIERYKLAQPDDSADFDAWKSAAENSKTQLEHQQLRFVILRLAECDERADN